MIGMMKRMWRGIVLVILIVVIIIVVIVIVVEVWIWVLIEVLVEVLVIKIRKMIKKILFTLVEDQELDKQPGNLQPDVFLKEKDSEIIIPCVTI